MNEKLLAVRQHPAAKTLSHVPLTLFLLLAMLLVFGMMSPNYLTLSNMINIIVQCSTGIGIVALGSYMAICSSGGVDLSLGGIMSFAGMTAAKVMTLDTPFFNNLRENAGGALILFAIVAALGVGAIMGSLNGLILSRTNLPSFIVTLGSYKIAETMSRVLAGGTTIRVENDAFAFIGGGSLAYVTIGTRSIGVLPVSMLILLALYIVFSIIMKRCRFGTYVYAIGGNNDAAMLSGIPVEKIRFRVFLMGGVIASIAGVVLTSRLTAASAANGLGLEFDGIAAAVVGGASMTGGKSTPMRTLIGVLIIGAMKNGFNLISMPNSVQMIAVGIVMIVIVAIDAAKTRGNAL